ncbi:MAG: sigma-70 family RNA polymerase sigma factor [Deltaproteobacteria bacterium]|nr:sigma-70 family RNA polymerase sigma factor [Deltaproteobacteria bacterium]
MVILNIRKWALQGIIFFDGGTFQEDHCLNRMNKDIKNPAGLSDQDTKLVRAFQAGDVTAFDELVLKHKDKLFNMVFWFLGDYQEANDCAQEIFIKIFNAIEKFRFESAFSTWLYRIAMNTCKNRIKSSAYRWKKRTVSIEHPKSSKNGNPFHDIENGSPSPANELEKKERLMLIQNAINSLPEAQNQMVVLRDIQGLSYQEIADITGLSLGTVKSRLARGRLELRNRLKGRI